MKYEISLPGCITFKRDSFMVWQIKIEIFSHLKFDDFMHLYYHGRYDSSN